MTARKTTGKQPTAAAATAPTRAPTKRSPPAHTSEQPPAEQPPAEQPPAEQPYVTPLLLTVDGAAGMLAIGRSLMYKLIWDGDVECIMVGRFRRVAVAELNRYIASGMLAERLARGHRSATARRASVTGMRAGMRAGMSASMSGSMSKRVSERPEREVCYAGTARTRRGVDLSAR